MWPKSYEQALHWSKRMFGYIQLPHEEVNDHPALYSDLFYFVASKAKGRRAHSSNYFLLDTQPEAFNSHSHVAVFWYLKYSDVMITVAHGPRIQLRTRSRKCPWRRPPLLLAPWASLFLDLLIMKAFSPTLVPFHLQDTTHCSNLPILFWNIFPTVTSFLE